MTSHSQPVAIKSPRISPAEPIEGAPASFATPIGTPDLRALRAQYAGTPPPPNIPLRGTTPLQRNGPPVISLVPTSDSSPLRPGPQAVGGISAAATKSSNSPGSGSVTPPVVDWVELPDEEKAKVLRRHLVSKEERQNGQGDARSITGSDLEVPHTPEASSSRRSSSGAHGGPIRQDSEAFPIPYHAPGADVT
jgi:proton-coupled amino acid transporter